MRLIIVSRGKQRWRSIAGDLGGICISNILLVHTCILKCMGYVFVSTFILQFLSHADYSSTIDDDNMNRVLKPCIMIGPRWCMAMLRIESPQTVRRGELEACSNCKLYRVQIKVFTGTLKWQLFLIFAFHTMDIPIAVCDWLHLTLTSVIWKDGSEFCL